MTWGTDSSKQDHYKKGRSIEVIQRDDIDGVCSCGYLTLKPNTEFEGRCGGLTVKKDKVEIRDGDRKVRRLRPKTVGTNRDGRPRYDFNTYSSCNACVNHWR